MTQRISPIEASELLAPGSTVFIQGGIGEPTSLLNALASNPSAGERVNFISVMVPGVNNYVPSSFHDTATLSTFFVFGELSASFLSGKTRFLPLHYSEIIPYIKQLPIIDTILIQTSPPDQNGQCSLGPSVDFVPALLAHCKTVIAEINSAMPRTYGSPSIAYRDVHYAVEACHTLPTTADYKASPETERIARNVVNLIENGDTLQFGIGNIPDAILSALSSHRGLGIHSGMITKAAANLIDSGVFTGENKAIDNAEHITGFALGDERFYQWAANCKSLKFRPVSYTHDVRIISALRNFVSINSAVQVDLFGQVNAEMVNNRQISGTGGALDFVRGARLSHNGRSIIALPATAAKGTQSRITARLGDQSIVSIPRTDVDYVVTEYGIASLAYKSTAERAEALINIAAPQFRDELAAQFEK